MITRHRLDSVYTVADFEQHNDIKERLLSLIDLSNAGPAINEIDNMNITKADWNDSTNMSREWIQFLLPIMYQHQALVLKEMGFSKFKIKEMWFQQYMNNASHGWHTHGSHFTNVYYLELPESAPKTVLINPFTRQEFVPDVKEGQTLVFPAYVVHKSPDDFFPERKTIISWNSDIDIEHPYMP